MTHIPFIPVFLLTQITTNSTKSLHFLKTFLAFITSIFCWHFNEPAWLVVGLLQILWLKFFGCYQTHQTPQCLWMLPCFFFCFIVFPQNQTWLGCFSLFSRWFPTLPHSMYACAKKNNTYEYIATTLEILKYPQTWFEKQITNAIFPHYNFCKI